MIPNYSLKLMSNLVPKYWSFNILFGSLLDRFVLTLDPKLYRSIVIILYLPYPSCQFSSLLFICRSKVM